MTPPIMLSGMSRSRVSRPRTVARASRLSLESNDATVRRGCGCGLASGVGAATSVIGYLQGWTMPTVGCRRAAPVQGLWRFSAKAVRPVDRGGPGGRLSPMQKVLVVDDDPHIRDVVCFALRRAGYQPLPADNGLAALRRHRSMQAAAPGWRRADHLP